MRPMCGNCPFNPVSPTFRFQESWAKNIEDSWREERSGQEIKPFGCHLLEDGPDPQPENICVGHQQWLADKAKSTADCSVSGNEGS